MKIRGYKARLFSFLLHYVESVEGMYLWLSLLVGFGGGDGWVGDLGFVICGWEMGGRRYEA